MPHYIQRKKEITKIQKVKKKRDKNKEEKSNYNDYLKADFDIYILEQIII